MSRWLRLFVPVLAAVVALGAGTAAASKIINGRSLKNGTVTEKKLAPAVRQKLNSAGPAGPQGLQGQQGPQGAPGNPAPAGRTAAAQTDAIQPLAYDSTATVVALDSLAGTGPLRVDGPSRLMITAQVNAFKTTSDSAKTARVACRLMSDDGATVVAVARRVEATMHPVSAGTVMVSVALVGAVTVAAGTHDIRIQCSSMSAPPANAGVSFLSASVNVDAVPL